MPTRAPARAARSGVVDHGNILGKKRYAEARKHLDDPEAYAEEKQKAGYSTDPEYAEKLKRIIRRYNLTRFDKK